MCLMWCVGCETTRLNAPRYAVVMPIRTTCVADCRAQYDDDNERAACLVKCKGATRITETSCQQVDVPDRGYCATSWYQKRSLSGGGVAAVVVGSVIAGAGLFLFAFGAVGQGGHH